MFFYRFGSEEYRDFLREVNHENKTICTNKKSNFDDTTTTVSKPIEISVVKSLDEYSNCASNSFPLTNDGYYANLNSSDEFSDSETKHCNLNEPVVKEDNFDSNECLISNDNKLIETKQLVSVVDSKDIFNQLSPVKSPKVIDANIFLNHTQYKLCSYDKTQSNDIRSCNLDQVNQHQSVNVNSVIRENSIPEVKYEDRNESVSSVISLDDKMEWNNDSDFENTIYDRFEFQKKDVIENTNEEYNEKKSNDEGVVSFKPSNIVSTAKDKKMYVDFSENKYDEEIEGNISEYKFIQPDDVNLHEHKINLNKKADNSLEHYSVKCVDYSIGTKINNLELNEKNRLKKETTTNIDNISTINFIKYKSQKKEITECTDQKKLKKANETKIKDDRKYSEQQNENLIVSEILDLSCKKPSNDSKLNIADSIEHNYQKKQIFKRTDEIVSVEDKEDEVGYCRYSIKNSDSSNKQNNIDQCRNNNIKNSDDFSSIINNDEKEEVDKLEKDGLLSSGKNEEKYLERPNADLAVLDSEIEDLLITTSPVESKINPTNYDECKYRKSKIVNYNNKEVTRENDDEGNNLEQKNKNVEQVQVILNENVKKNFEKKIDKFYKKISLQELGFNLNKKINEEGTSEIEKMDDVNITTIPDDISSVKKCEDKKKYSELQHDDLMACLDLKIDELSSTKTSVDNKLSTTIMKYKNSKNKIIQYTDEEEFGEDDNKEFKDEENNLEQSSYFQQQNNIEQNVVDFNKKENNFEKDISVSRKLNDSLEYSFSSSENIEKVGTSKIIKIDGVNETTDSSNSNIESNDNEDKMKNLKTTNLLSSDEDKEEYVEWSNKCLVVLDTENEGFVESKLGTTNSFEYKSQNRQIIDNTEKGLKEEIEGTTQDDFNLNMIDKNNFEIEISKCQRENSYNKLGLNSTTDHNHMHISKMYDCEYGNECTYSDIFFNIENNEKDEKKYSEPHNQYVNILDSEVKNDDYNIIVNKASNDSFSVKSSENNKYGKCKSQNYDNNEYFDEELKEIKNFKESEVIEDEGEKCCIVSSVDDNEKYQIHHKDSIILDSKIKNNVNIMSTLSGDSFNMKSIQYYNLENAIKESDEKKKSKDEEEKVTLMQYDKFLDETKENNIKQQCDQFDVGDQNISLKQFIENFSDFDCADLEQNDLEQNVKFEDCVDNNFKNLNKSFQKCSDNLNNHFISNQNLGKIDVLEKEIKDNIEFSYFEIIKSNESVNITPCTSNFKENISINNNDDNVGHIKTKDTNVETCIVKDEDINVDAQNDQITNKNDNFFKMSDIYSDQILDFKHINLIGTETDEVGDNQSTSLLFDESYSNQEIADKSMDFIDQMCISLNKCKNIEYKQSLDTSNIQNETKFTFSDNKEIVDVVDNQKSDEAKLVDVVNNVFEQESTTESILNSNLFIHHNLKPNISQPKFGLSNKTLFDNDSVISNSSHQLLDNIDFGTGQINYNKSLDKLQLGGIIRNRESAKKVLVEEPSKNIPNEVMQPQKEESTHPTMLSASNMTRSLCEQNAVYQICKDDLQVDFISPDQSSVVSNKCCLTQNNNSLKSSEVQQKQLMVVLNPLSDTILNKYRKNCKNTIHQNILPLIQKPDNLKNNVENIYTDISPVQNSNLRMSSRKRKIIKPKCTSSCCVNTPQKLKRHMKKSSSIIDEEKPSTSDTCTNKLMIRNCSSYQENRRPKEKSVLSSLVKVKSLESSTKNKTDLVQLDIKSSNLLNSPEIVENKNIQVSVPLLKKRSKIQKNAGSKKCISEPLKLLSPLEKSTITDKNISSSYQVKRRPKGKPVLSSDVKVNSLESSPKNKTNLVQLDIKSSNLFNSPEIVDNYNRQVNVPFLKTRSKNQINAGSNKCTSEPLKLLSPLEKSTVTAKNISSLEEISEKRKDLNGDKMKHYYPGTDLQQNTEVSPERAEPVRVNPLITFSVVKNSKRKKSSSLKLSPIIIRRHLISQSPLIKKKQIEKYDSVPLISESCVNNTQVSILNIYLFI